MELCSNLVWLAVSLVVLGVTIRQIRQRRSRLSALARLTAAFTLCLVLLPVISMTDDLLDNRQQTLPLASQTWHLAAEAASIGVEPVLFLGTSLLLMMFGFVASRPTRRENHTAVRRYTAWLTQAQRLRPPPFVTA